MSGHNYPDNLYDDALSRKTTPTGSYDAAKIRDETVADNDTLPSISADFRALLARLERYAERRQTMPERYDLKQGEARPLVHITGEDGAAIASLSHPAAIGDVPHEGVATDKPVCTQAEWDEARLGWAILGLKLPESPPSTSDYTPAKAPKWDPSWGEAYVLSKSQHPMAAEAIRERDEKSPEDRL